MVTNTESTQLDSDPGADNRLVVNGKPVITYHEFLDYDDLGNSVRTYVLQDLHFGYGGVTTKDFMSFIYSFIDVYIPLENTAVTTVVACPTLIPHENVIGIKGQMDITVQTATMAEVLTESPLPNKATGSKTIIMFDPELVGMISQDYIVALEKYNIQIAPIG